jgi:hypothetical protein
MDIRKPASVLALLFAVTVLHAQQTPNYEQIALNVFLKSYWGPGLFEGECTGLAFDPNFAILVFSDGPAFEIDSALMRAALPAPWPRSAAGGQKIETPLRVSLVSDQPYLKRTALRTAPPETEGIRTLEKDRDLIMIRKNFSAYLLRFSSRLILNGHTFVDVWIKQGYASNGAHVMVEMDSAGNVVRHVRYTRCDDEG